MSELEAKYVPGAIEEKWYAYWMEHQLFKSVPDAREPYTIVIPPPNVTGVLHMGHMLNNTIQDILVRRARMEGKNALWVPGKIDGKPVNVWFTLPITFQTKGVNNTSVNASIGPKAI